jgi:hypothetical protein
MLRACLRDATKLCQWKLSDVEQAGGVGNSALTCNDELVRPVTPLGQLRSRIDVLAVYRLVR